MPKSFLQGKSLHQAWLELIARRGVPWFDVAPDKELSKAVQAVRKARLALRMNFVENRYTEQNIPLPVRSCSLHTLI